MTPLVRKADGTTEPFALPKLLQSLERSGASAEDARAIASQIEPQLYNGISTSEIYAHAFARLRTHKRGPAARYSLKRSVLDFGPSGFPFEQYLAKLFAAEGFETRTDQLVRGTCVEHEVDVVMRKGGETIYVEAKFHNTAGFKTDLKTALYVAARIEDIRRVHPDGRQKIKGLLVTNTKFTDKALQYAHCQGLELLGWEYPKGNTLHDRIDRAMVYPVTALTTISKKEKTALLSDNIVLCKDLPKETRALSRAGVSGRRADAVFEEVGALCVPGKDI